MTLMEQLNEIWKNRTGENLTTDEAWKMVELVADILANADKNIEEATK